MKNLFFNILILLLSSAFLFSCEEKTSDPPTQKTPEELATEDLTGGSSQAWTVAGGGSVIRDGRSETNIYQNFEIIFAANETSRTYQTFNSNSLFEGSGNWVFAGSSVDKIILSGSAPASGQEISFTRTGNDLRLQFSIPLPSTSTGAVAGNYVFNLKRKQ
jgi:hypothetical protein